MREEELATLLATLLRCAQLAVRRNHLPRDTADDIAQESFRRIWSGIVSERRGIDERRIRTLTNHVAAQERRRRYRESVVAREAARGNFTGRVGIPRVCPRMQRLATGVAVRAHLYLQTLSEAVDAVAEHPRSLSDAQRRLFELAYKDQLSCGLLSQALGVSRAATTKRLRRLVGRLENLVLARIEEHLERQTWSRLVSLFHRVDSRVSNDELEELLEPIRGALEEVVHSDPGHGSRS